MRSKPEGSWDTTIFSQLAISEAHPNSCRRGRTAHNPSIEFSVDDRACAVRPRLQSMSHIFRDLSFPAPHGPVVVPFKQRFQDRRKQPNDGLFDDGIPVQGDMGSQPNRGKNPSGGVGSKISVSFELDQRGLFSSNGFNPKSKLIGQPASSHRINTILTDGCCTQIDTLPPDGKLFRFCQNGKYIVDRKWNIPVVFKMILICRHHLFPVRSQYDL